MDQLDHVFQIRSTIRPPFPPLITIQNIVRLLNINRPRRKFDAFYIYKLTTIYYMQINNNIFPITPNFFRYMAAMNWNSEASNQRNTI
ncbi:hypothetical protein RclHR1_00070011 [Rhizophagus clarus]|uniref:Uncharacterized protein n=1 Tax=Rhizophagus clarus TaxID=94130 RepID=A0A2Z6RV59_9GLOM|nr:hypothetical protein RclHR1_00070011 [Rhizophagus clarus]GES78184.1 hypothetical protein GLOIN_2v1771423 [Rhizophagus clarus]